MQEYHRAYINPQFYVPEICHKCVAIEWNEKLYLSFSSDKPSLLLLYTAQFPFQFNHFIQGYFTASHDILERYTVH